MKKSDFYFDLPEELIAQTPLERRDASRLLTLDKTTGAVAHHHFYELPQFLHPNDCLVLNDSRVLPARLLGHRSTGGAVEVLLLRDLGDSKWECLTRPGRKTQPGTALSFGDGELTATVVDAIADGNKIVQFHYDGIFLEVLERLGKMPLPPYIKAELQDQERYQTVYSRELGSAAAPTAGLHFTKELLQQIADMGVKIGYVTLHVGLGTFRPVKEDEIEDHPMHSEFCIIPEETARMVNETKANGGLPHGRELCGCGRNAPRAVRLDGHFHLSRLSIQVHGCTCHEFPSAGEHAHHARIGAGRTGAYPQRI